jgi:hypothetical protein
MATFKCLQSGQTVTFTYQHDIDSMKGHQGYIRIDEEITEQPVVETDKPKKLGRPKKVVENV